MSDWQHVPSGSPSTIYAVDLDLFREALMNPYTDMSIADLVALAKADVNDRITRSALQELHARRVSVIGIIPTSHAPERTTGRHINADA